MYEKVVLIGAGSAMFTRGLVADMVRRRWTGELVLVDIDKNALSVAEGVARRLVQAGDSGMKISAFCDRKQALPDATCVICTISVGGRRAWERDVFIPRRYDIYQPVGDTVMAGGISRAMRMIPAMVSVAEDVLRLCPKALFFNYGNPMSAVCRAVRKATGANVIGLCHGVFDVARYIANLLKLPFESMRYTAAGINHLTWFTQISSGGRDVMPRLLAVASEYAAQIRSTIGKEGAQLSVSDPFTWQMTDLFGAFPAVLDRHITEFFPHLFASKGAYFGKTLGVDAFSFERTIEWGEKAFAEMKLLAGEKGRPSDEILDATPGEHEQVVEIIESIRSGVSGVYSANLPNDGQIPNLPHNCVVESPAVTDDAGLRPLMLSPLTHELCSTLASRLECIEVTVEAALAADPRRFVQALLLDGCVSSVTIASQLVEEMLVAQKEYLASASWRF